MLRSWTPALLLAPALLTLAVYATGLGNGFVWIDHSEVLGRTKIIENWPEFETTFLQARNSAGYHRPLYDVLFTLDHAVWGDDPFGYHLSAVLLHALNTLLFTLLLARVNRLPLVWALFGGALFGVHPLNAAVAGLIHAKADLFGLTCMLLAVHAAHGVVTGRHRRSRYVLGVTACLLGVLTKELVFLLPPAVTVWGWIRRRTSPALLHYGLALCAVALPVGILHLYATAGLDRPTSPLGLGERLATFQTVYLEGLWLMVWPADARMADTVTRFAARTSTERIAATLAFATVLALMFLAARRWPRLRPWIVTYNLALVPVAQLVPILHFRADRYYYVSGLAFAGAVATTGAMLFAASGGVACARRPVVRRSAAALAAAVLAAAAVRVCIHLPSFSDDRTLFAAELARVPDYLEGATHLGRALERTGDWVAAERCYRLCLAPHPGRISYVDQDAVAVNLVHNLLQQRDDSGAWEVARQTIGSVRSPAHRSELRFNGGVAAWNLGQHASAATWLSDYLATAKRPDPVAWFLLGVSAVRSDDPATARRALSRYLEQPEREPSHEAEARRLLEEI